MSDNVLTNEIKRTIWERQNGMCALTGKKFQEFENSTGMNFVFIKPLENGGNADTENIVMVWEEQIGNLKGKLHKYNFHYANFANYDVDEKIAEIKAEIDEILAITGKTETPGGDSNDETAIASWDWRHIKNRIKEITNTLLSANIPMTQKNEFRDLLVPAIETVAGRQANEVEESRKVWAENYKIVKEKVNEAVEFAKTTKIFKEIREKLVAAQTEFRTTNISRENRGELEKIVDEAFADLNQRQSTYRENFEMECIENYYKIKAVVENAIKKAEIAEKFVAARDVLISAQNQIKEILLKREQKDELFTAIRNVFDALREKFGEVRLTDEEREANYEKVKIVVNEAIEFAKKATTEQAMEARDKLIAAQTVIKENRLRKVQNDELFAAIREVFEKVNEMSAEEREQYDAETLNNFTKMLSRIDVVMVEIENAIDFGQSAENLAIIRTELQLVKLKREQRNKLYDRTRAAFDLLSKMRDSYNKRKTEERTQKLGSTIASLEQKNARLATLLEKDKEILAEQTKKLELSEEETTKTGTLQIIEIVKARIAEREESSKITEKRITEIKKEIERIQRAANERKNRNKEISEETPGAVETETVTETEKTDNIS